MLFSSSRTNHARIMLASTFPNSAWVNMVLLSSTETLPDDNFVYINIYIYLHIYCLVYENFSSISNVLKALDAEGCMFFDIYSFHIHGK